MHSPDAPVPGPDEPSVPDLGDDATATPRPEEEVADVLRAKPDVQDHSQHPRSGDPDAAPQSPPPSPDRI